MKWFSLTLYTTALALSLAACSPAAEVPAEPYDLSYVQQLEITDQVPQWAQDKGYQSCMKTEKAEYYFAPDLAWSEQELASWAELIIQRAMVDYSIEPMLPDETLKIYFSKDCMQYKGRGQTSGLELCPGAQEQQGLLLYFLAGGRLPAWLCNGLETLWAQEAGISLTTPAEAVDLQAWAKSAEEKGLPGLGDEWFIPGLIQDELSDNVSAVAVQFVKQLSQEGQLRELLTCYLNEQPQEAQTLRAQVWEKASGIPAKDEDAQVYYYMMNQYVPTFYDEDLQFYVRTADTQNYFTAADWWTLQTISNYVTTGEDSIHYVEEWFGQKCPKTPTIYYVYRDGDIQPDGPYDFDNIALSVPRRQRPIGIAPQVAQAMLNELGISTAGYSDSQRDVVTTRNLEDALCEAIQLECIEQSDLPATENWAYFEMLRIMRHGRGDDVLADYVLAILSSRSLGYDANRLNADVFSHVLALNVFEKQGLDQQVKETGEPKRYLYNVDTTMSFVLYLLEERGSKEDFLKVYRDVGNSQEVYGCSFEELIQEWRDYLTINFTPRTVADLDRLQQERKKQ